MLNSQEMINRFRQLILGNLLVKGSAILLLGAVLTNLGSYLFHLVLARMLGVAEYGVLESLVSLAYFINVPIAVFSLVTVKYISQEKDDRKRALFVKKLLKGFLSWGVMGLAAFLLASPVIKSVVKVDSPWLIIGIGFGGYLGVYSSVFSASLQGLAKFFRLSLVMIFGSWLKLGLAVLLVLFGFGVGGAIYGIVLASFFTAFVGYQLLTRLLPFGGGGEISVRRSFKRIGSYSMAVLASNLSLTSFYTLDIILARYFLPPIEAGHYAALSVLGKIIFFASSPVSQAMFPLISDKKARGEDYKKLLGLSFLLVSAISFSLIIAYNFLPNFIVGQMFGLEKYQPIVQYLGRFAIFISLYALCCLLANFYLSIAWIKAIILPVLAASLQFILILIWHKSIDQIVMVNIFSMALLLLALSVLFLRVESVKIKINLPFGSEKI